MYGLKQFPTPSEQETPGLRSIVDEPAAIVAGEPFREGLPLGVVLGVVISVLVAVLLGGLTAVQLRREEHRERAAREMLMAESLAPLAEEIERAADLGEARRVLKTSVDAEITDGHPNFNLVLTRDIDGQVIGSAVGGVGVAAPRDALQAKVPVRLDWLPSGRGTLTAWQDSSDFTAEMAERRQAAWLAIAVTVVAIILVVQLAIYLLVTRPLDHVLTAIEKLEQGYPARVRTRDVARELRWLAWRFHHMSANLTNSARLLVAAHRRAMEASKSRLEPGFDPRLFDPLELDVDEKTTSHDILRRYLLGRCALMESFAEGDPRARQIAVQMWEQDAVEAEKIGEMDLRARIENAALTILDPEAFSRVKKQLDTLVAARADWCAATAKVIENAFARDGVTLTAIQQRSKHAAGAWRKMQERGLAFDDVSDLIAFRIIVPRLDDCYLALDIVHRLFEPEPFRFKDYIASPKANGYQSLHTSVCDRDGFVFEIQIRSVEMHRAAEAGVAAHWRYRASKSLRV